MENVLGRIYYQEKLQKTLIIGKWFISSSYTVNLEDLDNHKGYSIEILRGA